MVTRDRGSDPASVCYATIERAEELNSDLVLIDTAGRLHTSNDLMEELKKVVNVTRKRSKIPVYVVLVIDATTGQNGLTQAKEFNNFLDLDALIITKLDGTAKGGIALAISKELNLPILKIGVGEKIDDLRNFNAENFARAFIGSEFAPEETSVPEAPEEVEEPQEVLESEVQEETINPQEEDVLEPISEPEVQEEEIEEPQEVLESEVQHEIVEESTMEEPEDKIEPQVEPAPILSAEPEEEIKEEPEPEKKGKLKGLFRKLFVD